METLDLGVLRITVKNVVQTLSGKLLAGDEVEELHGPLSSWKT